MAKKAVAGATPARQKAREFKKLCQSLIRDRLQTKHDKARLAQALNISLSAAEALAYRGVGSLETYLGALFFLYDFNPKTLKDYFLNQKLSTQLTWSAREADQAWLELDQEMDEDEKLYWSSLIKAAKKLELHLTKKKS